MKMKNTIVLVEDFNIDILREAFRQGRLYIRTEAKSAKSIREEGIQTILQYVSRIHACAYLIVSAKRYHHSGVSGTIVSLKAVPL